MASQDREVTPPKSASVAKMQQASVLDSPSRVTRYQLRRMSTVGASSESVASPSTRRSTRGRHSVAGCASEDSDAASIQSEPGGGGVTTRRTTRSSSQQPRTPPKVEAKRMRRNSTSNTTSVRTTRARPRLSPVPAEETSPVKSPKKGLAVSLRKEDSFGSPRRLFTADKSPVKASIETSPSKLVPVLEDIVPFSEPKRLSLRSTNSPRSVKSPRLVMKNIEMKLDLLAKGHEKQSETAASDKALTPKTSKTPDFAEKVDDSPITPGSMEDISPKTPESGAFKSPRLSTSQERGPLSPVSPVKSSTSRSRSGTPRGQPEEGAFLPESDKADALQDELTTPQTRSRASSSDSGKKITPQAGHTPQSESNKNISTPQTRSQTPLSGSGKETPNETAQSDSSKKTPQLSTPQTRSETPSTSSSKKGTPQRELSTPQTRSETPSTSSSRKGTPQLLTPVRHEEDRKTPTPQKRRLSSPQTRSQTPLSDAGKKTPPQTRQTPGKTPTSQKQSTPNESAKRDSTDGVIPHSRNVTPLSKVTTPVEEKVATPVSRGGTPLSGVHQRDQTPENPRTRFSASESENSPRFSLRRSQSRTQSESDVVSSGGVFKTPVGTPGARSTVATDGEEESPVLGGSPGVSTRLSLRKSASKVDTGDAKDEKLVKDNQGEDVEPSENCKAGGESKEEHVPDVEMDTKNELEKSLAVVEEDENSKGDEDSSNGSEGISETVKKESENEEAKCDAADEVEGSKDGESETLKAELEKTAKSGKKDDEYEDDQSSEASDEEKGGNEVIVLKKISVTEETDEESDGEAVIAEVQEIEEDDEAGSETDDEVLEFHISDEGEGEEVVKVENNGVQEGEVVEVQVVEVHEDAVEESKSDDYIDEKGEVVDEKGEVVDEKGEVVDEDGEYDDGQEDEAEVGEDDEAEAEVGEDEEAEAEVGEEDEAEAEVGEEDEAEAEVGEEDEAEAEVGEEDEAEAEVGEEDEAEAEVGEEDEAEAEVGEESEDEDQEGEEVDKKSEDKGESVENDKDDVSDKSEDENDINMEGLLSPKHFKIFESHKKKKIDESKRRRSDTGLFKGSPSTCITSPAAKDGVTESSPPMESSSSNTSSEDIGADVPEKQSGARQDLPVPSKSPSRKETVPASSVSPVKSPAQVAEPRKDHLEGSTKKSKKSRQQIESDDEYANDFVAPSKSPEQVRERKKHVFEKNSKKNSKRRSRQIDSDDDAYDFSVLGDIQEVSTRRNSFVVRDKPSTPEKEFKPKCRLAFVVRKLSPSQATSKQALDKPIVETSSGVWKVRKFEVKKKKRKQRIGEGLQSENRVAPTNKQNERSKKKQQRLKEVAPVQKKQQRPVEEQRSEEVAPIDRSEKKKKQQRPVEEVHLEDKVAPVKQIEKKKKKKMHLVEAQLESNVAFNKNEKNLSNEPLSADDLRHKLASSRKIEKTEVKKLVPSVPSGINDFRQQKMNRSGDHDLHNVVDSTSPLIVKMKKQVPAVESLSSERVDCKRKAAPEVTELINVESRKKLKVDKKKTGSLDGVELVGSEDADKKKRKKKKLEEKLRKLQLPKKDFVFVGNSSQSDDDDAPTAVSFSDSRQLALQEESKKEAFLAEKERRAREKRKLKLQRLAEQKAEKLKRKADLLEDFAEPSENPAVPKGKKTYFGDTQDEFIPLDEAGPSKKKQRIDGTPSSYQKRQKELTEREKKRREKGLAELLKRHKMKSSSFIPVDAPSGATRFGVVSLKNLNNDGNRIGEAAAFRSQMLYGNRVNRVSNHIWQSQNEKKKAGNLFTSSKAAHGN